MSTHDPPCAPLQVHEARAAESAARLDVRVETLEHEYERLRAAKHDHGERLTQLTSAVAELRRDDSRHERAVTALETAVGELRSVVALLSQTAKGARSLGMEVVRWLVPLAAAGAAYLIAKGG